MSRSKLHAPILEAAAELFAASGFASTSTKQIANAANVNETTLFRLFKDKAALFEAALAYEVNRLVAADFTAPIDANQDFDAAVRASLAQSYRAYAPRYMRLSTFAILEKPEIMARFFRERVLVRYTALAARVKREQKAGRARPGKAEAMAAGLYFASYFHALFCATYQKADPFNELKLNARDITQFADTWLYGVMKRKK